MGVGTKKTMEENGGGESQNLKKMQANKLGYTGILCTLPHFTEMCLYFDTFLHPFTGELRWACGGHRTTRGNGFSLPAIWFLLPLLSVWAGLVNLTNPSCAIICHSVSCSRNQNLNSKMGRGNTSKA